MSIFGARSYSNPPTAGEDTPKKAGRQQRSDSIEAADTVDGHASKIGGRQAITSLASIFFRARVGCSKFPRRWCPRRAAGLAIGGKPSF
jgi:hypothetical protein